MGGTDSAHDRDFHEAGKSIVVELGSTFPATVSNSQKCSHSTLVKSVPLTFYLHTMAANVNFSVHRHTV